MNHMAKCFSFCRERVERKSARRVVGGGEAVYYRMGRSTTNLISEKKGKRKRWEREGPPPYEGLSSSGVKRKGDLYECASPKLCPYSEKRRA